MRRWDETHPWPPAGRRTPRPVTVEPCPACGAFLGRNHPACAACRAAIEAPWRADWAALLAAEGLAPPEQRITGPAPGPIAARDAVAHVGTGHPSPDITTR
jgi:hypothetical protein